MKIIDKIKRFFTRQTIPKYIITIEDATPKELDEFIKYMENSKKDEIIVYNKKIEIHKIK